MRTHLMPVFALFALMAGPASALINPDFNAETGTWQHGDGPTGWRLNLDSDDQSGRVEAVDFAFLGTNVFHFTRVQRGFGGSRLEQCVPLGAVDAIMLSTHIRTEEPHPELTARLRLDFFADDDCDQDSIAADNEQVQTDIGLSSERAPAGEWVRLESETRLSSELGDDVRAVRVSLRLRDRSDGGQPREPARIVWFDDVSLTADVVFLPEVQRAALRDLHHDLDGPGWPNQLGWMGAEGTECSWQGVTCNESGDSVIGLDLSGNSLLGTLPESITALDGLSPGGSLDLCWNSILVPEAVLEFVAARHLGGDPAYCQGVSLRPLKREMSSHFYHPVGRTGEGMMLHMLSQGSAVLYWATYDDEGQPLWLTGTARGRDRILRFEDLWTTRLVDDNLTLHRAGRASLVFVDDDDPECSQAILRFSLAGPDFADNDGRDLIALDGYGGCQRPAGQDPDLLALDGHWYDPGRIGEGLSLTPFGPDQILVNWFSYDDDGQQTWKIGAGSRQGDVIDFGQLIGFSGGSFNDFLTADMLTPLPAGQAILQRAGDLWKFEYHPPGQSALELNLVRIEAGPDLLASTGHRIDLAMSPADLSELYSRDIFSDERLPGTVRFDGSDEVQPLTGLRFRGSSGRRQPKKSFNIRFENAQPLLFGSDRMNLNAMYTDPSLMREALSFELFHALGRPAPRTRHFDLWINGTFEGTYTHIQRVDEWLLSMNNLNTDGTLVRDAVRGNPDLGINSAFALDLSGLDQEQRINLLSSNFDERGEPDWAALLDLIEWVQATPPGPDFQAGFEERFEVDTFIDWLAIHWLIGDIDSFGDDYWLYLDSDDPAARWTIIPWDKDLSFGSHWRGLGFDVANDWFAYEYSLEVAQQPGNALIGRFLATPALRQQATARLLEMIEQQFTPAWFAERIETLAELLADSASIAAGPTAFKVHPRNHHSARERYQDHIETMTEFVQLRQSFLVRRLTGPTGPIDQATALIPADSTDSVLLTDPSGATLARIRPLQAVGQDISISVSVTEAAELQGINRRWSLDLDGDLPEAELTLYYRNEISNAWGRGNWWTEGPEPVGRQDELQLSLNSPGGTATPATRVNPFANLASTVVALEAGHHEITLVLPD